MFYSQHGQHPKSATVFEKIGGQKARNVTLNYKEICHNLEMNLAGL